MTTEPTTTIDKLYELREQFKRNTKQAADALTNIMGVVDDIFDSLRKPIIVYAPKPAACDHICHLGGNDIPDGRPCPVCHGPGNAFITGPVVLSLPAEVLVTCGPNGVEQVRILPEANSLIVHDSNSNPEPALREALAWAEENVWEPVVRLSKSTLRDVLIWEG